MFRAIVIIGWEKSKSGPVPVNLYTGLDGVEAAKVAEKARASGKYLRLGRLNNPSHVPLPTNPAPTVVSGNPEPAKREPFRAITAHKAAPPARPPVAK